jgi:hypothetical protein
MKQSRLSADDDEGKVNNRPSAMNTPFRGGGADDRPITPMRTTYKQVANKYGDEDESPYHDRSPTRESTERTLKTSRLLSASQRSTMNSMSRTIDPRYAANFQQQTKNISPSRTIGSATKQRTSLNTSTDDSKLNLYQIYNYSILQIVLH